MRAEGKWWGRDRFNRKLVARTYAHIPSLAACVYDDDDWVVEDEQRQAPMRRVRTHRTLSLRDDRSDDRGGHRADGHHTLHAPRDLLWAGPPERDARRRYCGHHPLRYQSGGCSAHRPPDAAGGVQERLDVSGALLGLHVLGAADQSAARWQARGVRACAPGLLTSTRAVVRMRVTIDGAPAGLGNHS